MSFTHNFH
jgi:Ubiquinol-cytochrome C chaperone